MNKVCSDFLIIGSGIIGMTLAFNLRKKFPHKKIIIIEKEKEMGAHSSGRNSGVLHAGFYYTPDSLKARFTKEGNYEMQKFCENNNLKINKCGKVVVAKNEQELEILFELKKRGDKNGVKLYIINQKELKEIEPNAKTYEYALWSPDTSTIDPLEILKKLDEKLKENNIEIFYNTKYLSAIKETNTILTNHYIFSANKIINAAGLYADKIAKDFGFSSLYTILPFKGLYLEYTGNDMFIKRNIYPVPNIQNPFLGVHFTVKVDNKIKIGPTAIPCLWRENYNFISRFNLNEFIEISKWNITLFLKSKNFRKLAYQEIKKYIKPIIIKESEKLVNYLEKQKINKWSKPGIRAQLLNLKTLELVNDFVVEYDNNSLHILNAVSPAFTASFPFTRFIVEKYLS